MSFRLSWRGQPEGSFESVTAAMMHAEANSHKNSTLDADRIAWYQSLPSERGVCWGTDGYNNWFIYEASDDPA